MKGQVVFEFVIASLMLFGMVFYTISYVSSDFGLRHENFENDRLEAGALRVSDILLNDPANGIVDAWPVLNQSKMSDFQTACSEDYTGLRQKFGLREELPYIWYNHMDIDVTGVNGVQYLSCGRSAPDNVGQAVITRFGIVPPDKMARVRVIIW